MKPFTTHLRVRHYEMDAQGHVNNAVYQHYLEQAAIEHSESLGFTPSRYRELGGTFVMRRIAIDYLRPAFAGESLILTTWLKEMRGTRTMRHYEIRKQVEPGLTTSSLTESGLAESGLAPSNLLVTAEALWVWVDLKTLRPKAIPTQILETFGQLISQKQS